MEDDRQTVSVEFHIDDFKKLLLFLSYMSLEKTNGVNLFGAYYALDEVAKALDIESEGRSDCARTNRDAQENE